MAGKKIAKQKTEKTEDNPFAKKVDQKPEKLLENVDKKPVKKTVKQLRREKGKTRKSKQALKGHDPLNILLYPHLAEKSMNMIDMQNKLVFVVNPLATRDDVKRAMEELFKVKVIDVNIEITGGLKKAYIKLHPSNPASEIATKLGVL